MNTAEQRMDESTDQRKKQLMINIKALQSELVKTSMQTNRDSLQYAQLLNAINVERAKLKALRSN
jgi:hypothetical protein